MDAKARLKATSRAAVERVRAIAKEMAELGRRRPWLWLTAAGVVGLGALVAIGMAAGWDEDAAELVETSTTFAKPTLAQLQKEAKTSPRDAGVHHDLAHAYFAAGARKSGLRAYSRALALDPKVADDTLVRDVVGCFGRREQDAAASLLGRRRVTAAAPRLAALARDRRPGVRADAIGALAEMGRATRADYMAVYLLDLELADCAARRRAVDRLGAYADRNDKHVLAALRAAAKKDDEQTPWYRRSCLGNAPDQAQKKILARR